MTRLTQRPGHPGRPGSLKSILLLGLALLCSLPALPAGAEAPSRPPSPEPAMQAPSPPAAAHAPISYTLRFSAAATHRVDVEAVVPTGGADEVELMMAVWTPGSYLVREYARQVETIRAENGGGEPLALAKVRKNRWRVTTGGAAEVVLHYRLYCRELSVRTNFVDADFAILNGAPTFITRVDDGAPARAPHRVRIELPEGWRRAIAPLPEEDGAFVAADYDTLVDSPLYAGTPVVQQFEVSRGVESSQILLVHEGGDEVWDYERSKRDVEALVRTQAAFWDDLPFQRYIFFNLIAEAGGGLEHKDSTVLLTSRWKARSDEGWRDWLGLVSHELFHAWNVKRLHPESLGAFDYEAENYTASLWFVEGVTSYYDDLLVRRAGLATEAEYLATLGKVIESVQTTPGRLVQPLYEASFDAWIKAYRRDENSANRDISYYRKGSLVALLLDARIRRATEGAASLDDLMRAAWRRWGVQGAEDPSGYTPQELLDLVAEIADPATAAWLEETLAESRELDFQPALEVFGLELVSEEEAGVETAPDPTTAEPEPATAPTAAEGTVGVEATEPVSEDDVTSEAEEPPAWLGATTGRDEGRLLVETVPRGTPAFEAGLNVGDEILAIDGYRVPPAELDERLKAYRPGDRVELLVARREKLTRLPVTLGEEPVKAFYPRPAGDAGEAAVARRESWLGVDP